MTTHTRHIQLILGACALTAAAASHAAPPKAPKPPPAAPYTTEPERCIIPASQYHGINPHVLRAILKVESNLNPNAVGQNDNGTKDVGIGQMNSMHFKELSKFGIAPEHLKDACIGTYVAAWHLKKGIHKHGNTWFAVASYHSATPYFNNRYQILLNNELVKAGVIQNQKLPVPPLRPAKTASKPAPAKPQILVETFAAKD